MLFPTFYTVSSIQKKKQLLLNDFQCKWVLCLLSRRDESELTLFCKVARSSPRDYRGVNRVYDSDSRCLAVRVCITKRLSYYYARFISFFVSR
jgi:hypothetical protein